MVSLFNSNMCISAIIDFVKLIKHVRYLVRPFRLFPFPKCVKERDLNSRIMNKVEAKLRHDIEVWVYGLVCLFPLGFFLIQKPSNDK